MNKASDTSLSVHLSASAGSGKTRALKERYLALLAALDKSGLAIDQAVAITFTDKAAAEIKERVLHGLPEEMLKKIIRGKEDLRISTIHSFCMNLLKRYPLEAGLPPDFGVLDARDQANKIGQAIEEALEEAGREIMDPLRGFTVNELIATVEFLLSLRSKLKRMEIDAGGPGTLIELVRGGMDADAAEAELDGIIRSPEWKHSLSRMEHLLRSEEDHYGDCLGRGHLLLAEASDRDSAFASAMPLLPVYFTGEGTPRKHTKISAKLFRTKGNRGEYERLFFAIQDGLSRLRNACLRSRAARESVGLLCLYLMAEERYRQAKLREGLLDFDDLEICAYGLLQNAESADILYRLDRKVLHFLVDEFQDTSDIQWAILDKLTEEIFSGQGADKGMPPTLFVVGDEKQSIYRFREANYRLIADIREKMETLLPLGSRAVLTLDTNYRSTPAIIDTVNQVFTRLWGPDYKPSAADRSHAGAVQLIEVPPVPDAGPPGPSEAIVLARELRRLVGSGTTVYEKAAPPREGWKPRPAQYGDCAILLQSRTRLKEYEAALQDGHIPYRVLGGIGFYEEDEIQAIMNVLFFLWNNGDKLALAAALKSPLFGLTDQDLFVLMRDNGLPGSLKRLKPRAAELLEAWQKKAGLVPLAQLVHDIVGDTGAYILFGRRSRQAIFNIDKLLDTARDFDQRGYTTLQDFVEWVKDIRRTEQREATADMNLPGIQGAVSILTVHKAKGLEYPVVFLPGMGQTPRALINGPAALVSETAGARRIAIKDGENPVYEELWKGDQGEQEELRREHQRLLYVAMTRARDHLIMLGTPGKGKAPVRQHTWLDYLRRTLIPPQNVEREAGPRIVRYVYPAWEAGVLPEVSEAGPQIQAPEEKNDEVDARTVIENLSPLPLSGAPVWKRATDFIEEERMERSLEEPPASPAVRAVSPLLRGSVLHRCLENLTQTGKKNLEEVLAEFPELRSLNRREREAFAGDVASVLTTVAANRDLSWIFERHSGAWSELPFLLRRGREIVSGIIDRVVIRNGEGSVIDYKAILIENDEALASWKDHYRPQVRIYCEAVREIFGLESVKGYLLFLDSNRLELVV